MQHRKQIITAAGTLACAVGIGFFMQQTQEMPVAGYNGAPLQNANASILNVEEIVLTSASFDENVEAPAAEPIVPQAAAQEIAVPQEPALPEMGEPASDAVMAALDTAEQPMSDDVMGNTEEMTSSCEITATARPIAAAMVDLSLSAPCLPDERLTVHHAGMLFNEVTDAEGAFEVKVPAMSQEAVFIIAFNNGEGAVAQTTIEELADFDRVAVQWKGDTGFQLHALEFGAEYEGKGHVWASAPRDMSVAVTGEGGFLYELGDTSLPDSLVAEVYTFPTGSSKSEGTINLSVEAEVAQNNCGLEIEAQTLQVSSGNDITSKDLTLSVPDCDANGNFLVLNNLFEDLKVASR